MRQHTITILAAVAASLAASSCTTQDTLIVDKTKTASVENVTKDVAQRDLDAGKKHFVDANYGLSEKHFRKAVELNAANAEGWMGLAASYDQLGRFDLADRAYDQLGKIADNQPEIVSNRGYSYLLRGDFKQARKYLEEAKAAMPGNKRVEANLALLAKLKG